MNPEMKTFYDEKKKRESKNTRYTSINRTKDGSRLSKTIQVDRDVMVPYVPRKAKASVASTYKEHLNEHPQFVMKNMRYNSTTLGKYAVDKTQKLDKKINNHFMYHMSSEDKKVLCGQGYKQSPETRSSLDRYFERQKQKVTQSVLYSTFHMQQEDKTKQITKVFHNERMLGKRLSQYSKQ